MVEAVITTFADKFESLRKRKALVVIGTCLTLFLMGLSMCLQGGIYMLELFVFYAPGVVILIICFLQVVAVIAVFGELLYVRHYERFEIR